MGLCFSFPMMKTAPDSGLLMTWSKGFDVVDGVGKDVVQMFKESCAASGLVTNVPIVVNDSISLLASGR